MIQSLVASALQNNVPFSVILGHLEPGASAAQSHQDWKMNEIKNVDWRPAGVSEFFLARLVAQEPLPTFDAAEIESGLTGGRGGTPRRAFTQGNQHRVVLRVPQSTPYDAEDYRRDREAALQALALFERLAAEGKILRMLGIPSVYSVSGGAGSSQQAPVYTTQHFPIALEDLQSGDLLWVHPEAEHLTQGGRIGGGRANTPAVAAAKAPTPAKVPTGSAKPTTKPTEVVSTPKSAPEPPAMGPAWYVELQSQVEGLGIPEDKLPSALIKLRAGQLAAAAGSPDKREEFMGQADEEIKAAQAGPNARPAWFVALEEELVDFGVPQERLDPAIAKLRAKQIESEQGLAPEAAFQAAEREVELVRRGTPALPEWVTNGLAEAKDLGIPEANYPAFLVSQRARQLGNTLEAKAQARKEVEEVVRQEQPATPALPTQGRGTEVKSATAKAPKPAAEPQPDHELPEELQTLQKFIDDGLITRKQFAEAVGQDPSWATRALQGARGKMGLRPNVRDQILAINTALTNGTPLPEPLPKTDRHRRSRGGSASEVPEGSGGQLSPVEV